jgi:hypothetical protein
MIVGDIDIAASFADEHRALHGAGTGQVQELLAIAICGDRQAAYPSVQND